MNFHIRAKTSFLPSVSRNPPIKSSVCSILIISCSCFHSHQSCCGVIWWCENEFVLLLLEWLRAFITVNVLQYRVPLIQIDVSPTSKCSYFSVFYAFLHGVTRVSQQSTCLAGNAKKGNLCLIILGVPPALPDDVAHITVLSMRCVNDDLNKVSKCEELSTRLLIL